MEMLKEGITYKGTPEELTELLQRLPKIAKAQELRNKLSGEEKAATKRTYRRSNRYHKLSLEDMEFIRKNAGKITNAQIARKIKSTSSAVWYFLNRINKREQEIATTAQLERQRANLS